MNKKNNVMMIVCEMRTNIYKWLQDLKIGGFSSWVASFGSKVEEDSILKLNYAHSSIKMVRASY